MSQLDIVDALLDSDAERRRALLAVRALYLPDSWIGAGFVRDAVWDHLFGLSPSRLSGDVDVVWFDPLRTDEKLDENLEAELRRGEPGFDWSVKNQARMHVRNGDPPYRSTTDAMRFWPETATAVAARMDETGVLEIAAPFGLDDLMGGVLRPTPRFTAARHDVFLDRARRKLWMERWPGLVLADDDAGR